MIILSKEEINKWRTIVQTLVNYGLYDLLEDEIATVAKCLAREEGDNIE